MAPIRRAAPRPDFSSHPSDLEIINTYLLPWVATGELPKFIHAADVYAVGPDDLTAAYSPATASDGQEAWYFVTSLRAKSRRGQRKARTVGSGEEGCWHSERAAKPLFAGILHSRQIGYRQSFSFGTKEDGRLVRSGWLMAEIGLIYEATAEEELVLCKVYRSPRVWPAPGAQRSTAAAATGVGPKIGREKVREYSASSEDGVPRAGLAHLPLGYSARPTRVSSSSSDTVSTESDSEQDSSSQGVIGTSPPTRRVIAGDTTRTPSSEAYQAPQIPLLPSSPIRRMSASPGMAVVPSDFDAPQPDFASHPSDQELVKAYLIPRVASGEHPCKFTHDADVYTADPADLTREYSPATARDGDKAWYFFTSLPAKSIRGQRRPRTVATGEGCWHSEAGAKAVVDGGRQIGRRQFFSFMKKGDGQHGRTGWIMVEIGLNHGQEEDSSDELVLCKVYRSPRAGPAPGAAESMAAAAAAASGHKRKVDSNNSVAGMPVPWRAPGVERSTAMAASSGRNRKADDKNSGAGGPVLGPARSAKKSTAASAASRRKTKANDKNSGAACPVQLCTRCRIETAESHSGTADAAAEEDETRGRSETGVLEDDLTADESAAPHGDEAGDSSESARPTFYHFV